MPWECFCWDFALVQHVAPLYFQWPLAQLVPAAWSVLSLSSIDVYDNDSGVK
jgi:hypothetical protein